MTQNKLAEKAGCSLTTITSIEQGKHKAIRPTTAHAIYRALASPPNKSLTESEAAIFFKETGIDPNIVVDDTTPPMLDDVTRLQELAAERISYDPVRVRAAAIQVSALNESGATITITVPATVVQLVANMVAVHGPEKAEQLLRSTLNASRLPPGFIKTPPIVEGGYSVSEVIPAAAPKAKRLDQGTGPASRRRARGG